MFSDVLTAFAVTIGAGLATLMAGRHGETRQTPACWHWPGLCSRGYDLCFSGGNFVKSQENFADWFLGASDRTPWRPGDHDAVCWDGFGHYAGSIGAQSPWPVGRQSDQGPDPLLARAGFTAAAITAHNSLKGWQHFFLP